MTALTIRRATPADTVAIRQLAQLDSSRAPEGEVLVAEINSRILSAVSVNDFHTIADPFKPTAELSVLLTERARQLRRDERRQPRRWRVPRLRAA